MSLRSSPKISLATSWTCCSFWLQRCRNGLAEALTGFGPNLACIGVFLRAPVPMPRYPVLCRGGGTPRTPSGCSIPQLRWPVTPENLVEGWVVSNTQSSGVVLAHLRVDGGTEEAPPCPPCPQLTSGWNSIMGHWAAGPVPFLPKKGPGDGQSAGTCIVGLCVCDGCDVLYLACVWGFSVCGMLCGMWYAMYHGGCVVLCV